MNIQNSLIARLKAFSPKKWRQANDLLNSGLFDRVYYRDTNDLRWFWNRFPELHFVAFGETFHRAPNSYFSVNKYSDDHPDLTANSNSVFHHYVRIGQFDKKYNQFPVTDRNYYKGSVPHVKKWSKKNDVAVIVHVYYPEIWLEIAEILKRVEFSFDLIITLSESARDRVKISNDMRASFRDVRILELPNLGRDIFPFVHLINSGSLSQYDAICKLHTKKSPHLPNGDIWRDHLLAGLFPENYSGDVLKAFLSAKDAKILVANGYYFEGEKWWGRNKPAAEKLLSRLGFNKIETPLKFPAGSMYWMKPETIEVIRSFKLTPQSFEIETGQLDDTLAHCFERILGYIAAESDGRIYTPTLLAHTSLNNSLHLVKDQTPILQFEK